MRYRVMASYRGVPYEAGIGPAGSDVVLFAACPPPEELGFEPAPGHWRKHVMRAEVDALWESRPVGIFRGEPCLVLDDLGDRLHIAYLGTDAERAAALGYWQVDRGVFELLAARDEVTGLAEERVDKPLRWSGPDAGAGPGPDAGAGPGPAYPYGSAPRPAPPAPPEPVVPEPALPEGTWNRREPPNAESARASTWNLPEPGAGDGSPAPHDGGTASPASGLAATSATGGYQLPGQGRAARRQRVTAQAVFCELADLAAIPRHAYALGSEIDGAMCLVASGGGWEVFVAADGTRHEVRSFPDEEAAYFYLFGVLAAEAVRSGGLAPI